MNELERALRRTHEAAKPVLNTTPPPLAYLQVQARERRARQVAVRTQAEVASVRALSEVAKVQLAEETALLRDGYARAAGNEAVLWLVSQKVAYLHEMNNSRLREWRP